jgi:hypothetical protein
MERLLALDERREKIESLIIASMKLLHSATRSMQSELQAMYDGRTADIEELGDLIVENPLEGLLSHLRYRDEPTNVSQILRSRWWRKPEFRMPRMSDKTGTNIAT